MSLPDTTDEVTADDLIKALADKGVESFVYQTGGSTATIYATMKRHIVIAGPGAYNHDTPAASIFNTGDLYVGTTADEDPGVAIAPGATVEQIVEVFLAADR